MFGLNRNCSYKLYANSDLESRGVAIAVKRSIIHEVLETYKSADQNVILVKVRIKGVVLTIGTVYGPNENNREFFVHLQNKLQELNCPFIIGGDFNTVLDPIQGEENLDMSGGGGGGRPPNY